MSTWAYYNEHDPFAAAWLERLILADLIAPGVVDSRDIQDVTPDDLTGFAQCHFFAGIGGWSYALRLAGWPDDAPVWTGSCPCQPFSAAGAGGGFADERHLWPFWHWLVDVCRPPIVFGEQVASPAGRLWFDLVSTDLEGSGYAVGAADLAAASVGAPGIRQRLWWVADTAAVRHDGRGAGEARDVGADEARVEPERLCITGGNGLAHAQTRGLGIDRGTPGHTGHADERGATAGFWHPADWLPCTDGKARPVEPGTFPLAHGIPARVGRLRGYGNAINPQVAAAFIEAYCATGRLHP